MCINKLKKNPSKFVIIGGKGGVGKTTISSAIAYMFSSSHNTLLASIDPTHNLSSTFSSNLEDVTIFPFNKTLSLLEISLKEITISLDHEYLRTISNISGITEAIAIHKIYQHCKNYETIVLDTSVSAFVKALTFPTLFNTFLNKNKYIHDKLSKYALYTTVLNTLDTLRDVKKETKFLLTLTPAYISVYNTKNDIELLDNYDIETDGIIINKILNKKYSAEGCSNCNNFIKVQNKHLKTIDDEFGKNMGVVKIYNRNKEELNIEDIKEISKQIDEQMK
ncbi:Arsenite-transporting ATPase [Spraguea lophii 42_110]|uniref:Arsenite-transporting ATPase n=1 Tax=Spraguea lophii (strain 42_110) TaxID=1358809 RepID=S7WCB4_SPRLO|nr:Arsenite-transporting ATPase [Spraguea lophii 42_110]